MARGNKSEVGTIRIAPNKYRYVKTEEGWRLLHHVIAEKKLGRALRPDERVYFVNGDRADFDPSNLDIQRARRHTAHRLYVKILKMEKELAYMKAELEGEIGKFEEEEAPEVVQWATQESED